MIFKLVIGESGFEYGVLHLTFPEMTRVVFFRQAPGFGSGVRESDKRIQTPDVETVRQRRSPHMLLNFKTTPYVTGDLSR